MESSRVNFSTVSKLDAIQAMLDVMRTHDIRISDLERKVSDFDGDTGYATIVGYARRLGVAMPLTRAQFLGKKAKAICQLQGIRVGRVKDEHWGYVGSYPLWVLEKLF